MVYGVIHGGIFMGTEGNRSVVREMAHRYNQLYLTPEKGISATVVYSDIVRFGKVPEEIREMIRTDRLTGFRGNENARLFSEITPAGKVEIVYLEERSDFDRFLQIMAFAGEPAEVGSNIESAEILGVTNWRRIEAHMNDYLENGTEKVSWRDELRRFTDDKQNYQDSIILIGSGGYCGLSAAEAGYDEFVWENASVKIKIYSSCAKFIMRRLFSDYKNIIWEEMLSDCIGLLFVFNKYDVSLAKKLLGVSKKGYDRRGKLINFCGESCDDIDELAVRIAQAVEKLGTRVKKLVSAEVRDYYDVLFSLEEDMNEFVSVIKG
jgi:hypothetical protein